MSSSAPGVPVCRRGALLRDAVARLAEAGVASPEYDAAELLAHVLGTTRSRLPLVDSVDPAHAAAFDVLVDRRAAREPLQHLTGAAAFRHVELAVGPGVFVPRPETELLAGWAIERAREAGEAPVVVDLCCGSGAIALSVADEVPDAEVHAVELDPAAHAWAERNLGPTRVDLRLGDMADALPDLDGAVDVVACNPPYIPLEAWASVAPEVRDHDPVPRAVVRRGRARRDAGARVDGGAVAASRGLGRGRARRRAGRVGCRGCSSTPAAGPRCATTATWQVVRAT